MPSSSDLELNIEERNAHHTNTSGSATGGSDRSTPSPNPSSTPVASSSQPAPLLQSRSGRAVRRTDLFNAKPPEPQQSHSKKKSTSASTSAASSASSKNKKPTTKPKSKSKKSQGAAYSGEGYTVRDHSWYPGQTTIEYASPPIPHLRELYVEVSCEDACKQAGLTMTREMQVDLRQSTLTRLRASLSSDREMGEIDKTVLALCERGDVRGCALFQSDRADVDSIKVVTTRFIKNCEIITIYMGRLVEADQFHADYGDRSLYNVSSYDIRKDDLPADYTGPLLMLDTNVCANEAKFIRDARWDDHEISPNVQCRIVWNHQRGLPFVALVALGDIDAHAELFVDWGDQAWSIHARNKLHRMAHMSYQQHFRLRQIQRALADHGVGPYAQAPNVKVTDDVAFENFHYANDDINTTTLTTTTSKAHTAQSPPAATTPTPHDANNYTPTPSPTNDPSQPTPPLPPDVPPLTAVSPSSSSVGRLESIIPRDPPPPTPFGHAPTFILRNTQHVFDNCGVKLMPECDYSGLSQSARDAWSAVASAGASRAVRSLSPALLTVLQTGRCPKAGVYEVVSLRHPARFYSPPDCPTYALLAREAIDKGEPIGIYVGKVHEAGIFHGEYKPEDRIKQVYAYDMNASLYDVDSPPFDSGSAASAAAGSSPSPAAAASSSVSASSAASLPDLVCESLSIGGNETRFVNDCWCRTGGTKSKNAEPWPTYDPIRRMPVIIIRAARRIEKGEEIVTDYGETFWCKISTALSMEHQIFQQKAVVQIEEAENKLKEILKSKERKANNKTTATHAPSSSAASSSHVAVGGSSDLDVDHLLPSPPDRWQCYRELFNQFDVIYTHRSAPVRLDPTRHVDTPFLLSQVSRLVSSRRDAHARAADRAARAVAREKAALAKLNKGTAALTQPKRSHTLPGARTSSRVSEAAQRAAEEAQRQKEREEHDQRIRAEKAEMRKKALAAKRLAKEAELSAAAVAAAAAASSASPVCATPVDQPPATPTHAAADAATGDTPPHAAGVATIVSEGDSDVEIVSAPPSVPRSQAHRVFQLSHARESFVCDCGGIAIWRTWKETSFKACRACFKKRCTELIGAANTHAHSHSHTRVSVSGTDRDHRPNDGDARTAADQHQPRKRHRRHTTSEGNAKRTKRDDTNENEADEQKHGGATTEDMHMEIID